MTELLTYSLLVEPDRQRIGHFVMHAVSALGGSRFAATTRLNEALAALREATRHSDNKLDVTLALLDNNLTLSWAGGDRTIVPLPTQPSPEHVDQLARQLRLESENADTSLLKLRNQEISAELERLTAAAEEKMQTMEQALERKRVELESSIRQAETDSLTGLLNRGAYDDRLARSLAEAQAQRRSLSLILLDLDFFKQVNDQHGHQHGDRHLQRMADAMRRAIRQEVDMACRMGGDEFAIICFCELPATERIAERILHRMNRQVSIGIAQSRPDDTVDSLVARADASLYLAKRRGRNRYVLETELPAEAASA